MLFICEQCFTRQPKGSEPKNLEFDRYEEWISHIIGKSHQRKVEITLKSWKDWENRRSVVLTLIDSTPLPQPIEIIEYFSYFGMIAEFYHDRDTGFCILRIDPHKPGPIPSPNMKINDVVHIGGVKVKVVERSSFSPVEWNIFLNCTHNNMPNSSDRVVDSLKIEVKQNVRQVTAIKSSNNGLNIHAKEKNEIVEEVNTPEVVKGGLVFYNKSVAESSASFSGSNMPLSVITNGDVAEQSSRKKRSKNRKSKKFDSPLEKDTTLQSVNSVVPEPLIVENQQSSQPDIKKDEVQFRGGFNVGPQFQSSSLTNSVVADDAPKKNTFLEQKSSQPLPFHHGPMNQPPFIPTAILPRPKGSQNNNLYNPQQVYPSQQRQPQPRILDRSHPPPLIPQSYYRQEYTPRTMSMPFNEFHRVSQAQPRMIHPNQPMYHNSNNIPGHSQVRSRAPVSNSRRSEPARIQSPLPKFTNLFYSMITESDHRTTRRSNLGQDFEKLTLQEQLKEFVDALTLDEGGRRQRMQLLDDLQCILRADYSNCCIYPFGSFLTGLGDLTSDVDVYVDAFGVTRGRPLPKSESSTIDVLNRCKKILHRAKCPHTNRPFCNNLVPIREARVPILKLNHISSVHLDLSFENLISLKNSEMIKLYMNLHPVVRPLITLIRYWGKFHNLTGSNSIKNYALILLIIVFLTKKGVVPPVDMLQKMKNDARRKSARPNEVFKNPEEIEGWDTSFCDNIDEIRHVFKSSVCPQEAKGNLVKAVGQLAGDFFDMCATTDFYGTVICTYTSEILPKSLFTAGNEEDLPNSLDRYKEWAARQTTAKRLNIKTALCIQDPFILSFNVGGVTPNGILLKFQVACAQTAKTIKSEEFNSLLDTFIPLPKEIGDKKFMSMQERQKRTKELKKEITQFIADGTTAIPSEDDSNDSEETIALHLLPIEKIIDKSTIRFGKGWESFTTYQPCKDFQNIFAQEIRRCRLNGSSSFSPRNLVDKLKIVWIEFVSDFLSQFWTRCMNLEVSKEERIKIERLFSTPPFCNKPRNNYESIFIEKERKDKKKNNPSSGTDVSVEHVNRMKEKLSELGVMQEKIIYQKLMCTVYDPVWQKRDRIAKEMNKSNNEGPFVTQVVPTSSGTEVSKKRSKKRSKPVQVAIIDPLEIEERITDVILKSSNKGKTSNRKPLVKFITFVKLDYSFVDELPTVYLVFEKVEGSAANYTQGVSTFVDIIDEVLPQYMMYRLNKFLEPESNNVNASVIDFVNQNEDLASPVLDNEDTIDNDYDLLMPPSSESESECDEDPEPETINEA